MGTRTVPLPFLFLAAVACGSTNDAGGIKRGTGSEAEPDDAGAESSVDDEPVAFGSSSEDDALGSGGAVGDEAHSEPSASEPSRVDVPKAPSAPDGGVSSPTGDPMMVEMPDAPPEPLSNIWYYVDSVSDKTLNNILRTNEDGQGPTGVNVNNDALPWSPDGTELARVVNGKVVFYALDEQAEVVGEYAASGYTSVVGWIPGFGAILTGMRDGTPTLGVMKPDGTHGILQQGADAAVTYSIRSAPNGSEVTWSSKAGDGYAFWHCSIASGGTLGEPEVLAEYATSPVLTAVWSPTSDWLAIGLGSVPDEGGVYFWRPGIEAPFKVSRPLDGYSPHVSFSSDGSHFVMHLPGEAEPTLVAVAVTPSEVGELQVLGQSEGISPGRWAEYGQTLTYVDEQGSWLHRFDGGVAGPRIAFPAFGYPGTCPTAWLSETEFVACSLTGGLVRGALSDGTIQATEVSADALGSLALSPGGACLMDWDATTIRVGSANGETFAKHIVPTTGDTLSFVSFTPDGAGIVWTEGGQLQYYAALANCTPTGAVANIRGRAESAQGGAEVSDSDDTGGGGSLRHVRDPCATLKLTTFFWAQPDPTLLPLDHKVAVKCAH